MPVSTPTNSRWVHPSLVSVRYGQAVRAAKAIQGLVLVAAQAGALLLLLRLDLPSVDWSDPAAWLDRVPPEDAVIALVRIAAVVTAVYFIFTTALYVVARLTRLPAVIRGVSVVTLPGVRRIVDGAFAAALVVSPASMGFAAAPASAEAPPPATHAYVPVAAGDTRVGYTPTPAGEPPVATAGYVVRPGDNLWTIAAGQLSQRRQVNAELLNGADVADFWRQLVDLNITSLTSGDPDLIYPGEPITLPAE